MLALDKDENSKNNINNKNEKNNNNKANENNIHQLTFWQVSVLSQNIKKNNKE